MMFDGGVRKRKKGVGWLESGGRLDIGDIYV